MLADKDIELVIVNTPSVTHYEYARQTIEAGKHLIVEKPFTATVKQAEELIGLAKRRMSNFLFTIIAAMTVIIRRSEKRYWMKEHWARSSMPEIHYDRYVPAMSYKAHKETPTNTRGGKPV
jgi:hypothetical protein